MTDAIDSYIHGILMCWMYFKRMVNIFLHCLHSQLPEKHLKKQIGYKQNPKTFQSLILFQPLWRSMWRTTWVLVLNAFAQTEHLNFLIFVWTGWWFFKEALYWNFLSQSLHSYFLIFLWAQTWFRCTFTDKDTLPHS
jgi:hypothetical protein